MSSGGYPETMTPSKILIVAALVLAVLAALVGWNVIDASSSALAWQGLVGASLGFFLASLLA